MGRMDGEVPFRDTLRQLEDDYYSSRTPEVLGAIDDRNEGREMFHAGDLDGGLAKLEGSVGKLRGLDDDAFLRELYASTAWLSRILATRGEFDKACEAARSARILTPQGLSSTVVRRLHDYGTVDSPVRLNAEFDVERSLTRTTIWPDQYEVIFSGVLSLVLATSSNHQDLRPAAVSADRARRLARISERRDRVAFADRGISTERREETRSRFGQLAWLATGNVYLPLGTRRRVAQKVLAK